ncbi:5-formyltetrahydrofolate cyclo-ligase [Phytophthora nicotianae]|uniref:5-formyltetrahydrofolate cyclo-ligase n=2 Tax=Phytophthora nicotianae TaxID=4792 RepID=A0A0W8DQW2_PHYNI|nr:5-formyltetrahydrofolate cyclo-ligase [Phytophthora nicotianae]
MAGQWRALPLVFSTYSGDGATLQVSPDARDALLSIHASKMSIMGVFGPPASGKRLLLHTLLQPQEVDFSATPENEKNVLLWLWLPQDENTKTGDKTRIVLAAGAALETENGQQTENQKLALLLLLSSALLYNVNGEINAEAVERLQWVEKVAQVLRIKAMQDEEAVASEFHEHAPKFIWLARNFKIKWLKDAQGQKLTPTQYFEQGLAPKEATETPQPRETCCFVEAVDELYADYLSDKAQKLPAKQLMGHELRSEQFVAVLDAYVDAINTGQLPTMQKASYTLLEQEVTEAIEVARQSYTKEMQAVTKDKDGEKTLSERALFVAHVRGVQAAMAHLREVRSKLPERLRKTLFMDSLVSWEAQMKSDFVESLERNTKLSTDICTKVLEHVLPQNLEAMAAELAERSREEFSDGLVRLLTQYKSDLRSALDQYMQQSSGPAVDSCLEEALLQSVRGSIQKWSVMVLQQYKTHMRSWQEEKENLDREYELSKVQDAETNASANDQKRSYEDKLAHATEQLSELRRALHSELNSKKSELERLTTEITTMNLKHEVRVQNAESDLAWARSRTEELEKSIAADRQRKAEISAATAQVLERQRSFHKEERSLLVQQKELMAQIVQLERELVHKKTKHVQKVFGLQNEQAKKVDTMRTEQAQFERQLKSQAKKDMNSLKLAYEKEKKAILAESAALDQEMADIQEKLAVFEAEEEAARTSAAASRDFFKSMPMISLPLMQAPAPLQVSISQRGARKPRRQRTR